MTYIISYSGVQSGRGAETDTVSVVLRFLLLQLLILLSCFPSFFFLFVLSCTPLACLLLTSLISLSYLHALCCYRSHISAGLDRTSFLAL